MKEKSEILKIILPGDSMFLDIVCIYIYVIMNTLFMCIYIHCIYINKCRQCHNNGFYEREKQEIYLPWIYWAIFLDIIYIYLCNYEYTTLFICMYDYLLHIY
jgi:hypothetical protein